MKPRIAPRFSSGRASIMEALNTELPILFKKAARTAKILTAMKLRPRYARIINTTEQTNPTAMAQNRVLGFSFRMPRSRTPRSAPTV